MKLRKFLVGLLLTSVNVVSGISSSKTIPNRTTSKTIETTNNSTTITTNGTKTLPLILNPNDFWYVETSSKYHKILDGCGDNGVRSIERYMACINTYGLNVQSNIYTKLNKSTKVPVENYSDRAPIDCGCTKGRWEQFYMNDAIRDCNKYNAKVIHYGDCISNSPYYVCDVTYTKHLDVMTFVDTSNPNFRHVYKKRDLSNNNASEITTKTKTLPYTLSTVKATSSSSSNVYDYQIKLLSNDNYCCDCSSNNFRCCHPDEPVSVALVDDYGVWGIQLFDQKYDWCIYKDKEPSENIETIITSTTTKTIPTCIPLTLTTTITERETQTKKNYVTVTVTE